MVGWTNEELELLQSHVNGSMTSRELQKTYFPNRTISSVASKRTTLKKEPWTEHKRLRPVANNWSEDEDDIISKYKGVLTCHEIQEQYLPHRTFAAIARRIKDIGLGTGKRAKFVNGVHETFASGLTDKEIYDFVNTVISNTGVCLSKSAWTEDELFYLVKFYGTMSAIKLHEKYLPDRSPSAIGLKASRIGISGAYDTFTDKDDQNLIDLYLSGLSYAEISEKTGRLERSVAVRIYYLRSVKKLDICRRYTKWTNAEDDTLKIVGPFMTSKEISERVLKDRTPRAISIRRSRLNKV